MKKMILRVTTILIFSFLFLSGCGGEVDREVTFFNDETWKANLKFIISEEAMASLGSPEMIENELRNFVAEAEQEGLKASWKSRQEDRGYQYDINIEGQDLSLLNEVVFEGNARINRVEIDGSQAISFTAAMTGDILSANQNTVTIHGGEILNGNGTMINDGTIQWVNPTGTIEATLIPKGKFNLGTLLIIILLAAVIGGVGWYFLKQTTKSPTIGGSSTQAFPKSAATKSTTQNVYCVYCGEVIDPSAKFCPHCGKNQMIDLE